MIAGCRGQAVDGGGLSRGQPRERSRSQRTVRRSQGRRHPKMERGGNSWLSINGSRQSMNEEEVMDGLDSLD